MRLNNLGLVNLNAADIDDTKHNIS
jgi:hypothetical protein